MMRWLKPTLILALTLIGAGVALFPNQFVWNPRYATAAVRAISAAQRLPKIVRAVYPSLQAAPKQDSIASRILSGSSARVVLTWPKAKGASRFKIRPLKLEPQRAEVSEIKKLFVPLSWQAASSQASPPLPTATLRPEGFVQSANGRIEAVISGPDGVQIIHEGQVLGSQRVLKVSPDSVELVRISSSMNPPGRAHAGSIEPALADAASYQEHISAPTDPDRKDASFSKSLGYVELADGSRSSILPDGGGVRIVPEGTKALVAAGPTPSLAALAPAAEQKSIGGYGDQPPENNRFESGAGVKRPTGSTGELAGKDASVHTSPVEAVFAAQDPPIGFVQEANGRGLAIFAQPDGIRLIPGRISPNDIVQSPLFAVNTAAKPTVPGGSPLPGAEEPGPSDRSPPGQEGSDKAFVAVARPGRESDRASPTSGSGVRPWFWDLPGMGEQDATASYVLNNPARMGEARPSSPSQVSEAKGMPRPPPATMPPEDQQQSGNQHLGYIEWADGHILQIFAGEGEVRLAESGEISPPTSATLRSAPSSVGRSLVPAELPISVSRPIIDMHSFTPIFPALRPQARTSKRYPPFLGKYLTRNNEDAAIQPAGIASLDLHTAPQRARNSQEAAPRPRVRPPTYPSRQSNTANNGRRGGRQTVPTPLSMVQTNAQIRRLLISHPARP